MVISPNYLFIASIITLVVSFFVLKSTLKEKSSLRFLGASFFTMSVFFIVKVFNYKLKFLLIYPDFLMTVSPLMFLTAPLFYLGIRGLVLNRKNLRRLDWFHFLPALIHFLELIPLYFMPREEKLRLIDFILTYEEELVTSAHGLIPMIWVDVVRLSLMGYYFSASWILIYQGKLVHKILDQKQRSSWFRASLFYFGIIQAVFLVQYFFNLQTHFTHVSFPMIRNGSILIVFFTISIYVIQVVRKTRVVFDFEEFDSLNREKKKSNLKSPLQKEEQLSKLLERSSSDIDELKEALRILLEVDLIFKEKDLTVIEFAKRLKISVRYLPELLNQVYGKNFKELINLYRSQYAKRKIEEGYLEAYTLESLAELVGFNSRITFYNVFKKEFNLSPTEYWKKISEN